VKNRHPPPLNFIRSFECAARHLSFTLAASELGYTQAAVSAHVRALEKYVGWPLFHRKARSLKLTDLGEAFLPTLRQALMQIDNATEAIVTSSRDRSVTLACPMSLAENRIAQILRGFSGAYPNTEVVVQGTVWENPKEIISDLAISINREDEVGSGSVKLWEELLVLVCAPELALRITCTADVAELPKIFVLGRQEYWTIFSAALGLSHVDLDRGHKTNASNIALEMAANGLGLTVALSSLATVYLQRGILVEPFEVRPASPWSYYMRDNSNQRRLSAERLKDWIITTTKPE
jgi:DNA-binding transcriptional LysR family regulator